MYCNLPAYFVCSNTNTIPALNAALGSPGQFCTIRLSDNGTQYLFNGSPGKNVSASDKFCLGLQGGLIVGLPNIAEPGSDQPRVVCFDLVCRNCYDNLTITRQLSVDGNRGTATCNKCNRVYNLNNQGIISSGDPGSSLFRYRVSYIPYTLTVSNL